MTVNVYTHVCPAITDDQGKRVSGCNKGWTSGNFTEKCSTCGKPAQIRGQYLSIPLGLST